MATRTGPTLKNQVSASLPSSPVGSFQICWRPRGADRNQIGVLTDADGEMFESDPEATLVPGPTRQDATYSAAWICDIADITRDEVYVNVHA